MATACQRRCELGDSLAEFGPCCDFDIPGWGMVLCAVCSAASSASGRGGGRGQLDRGVRRQEVVFAAGNCSTCADLLLIGSPLRRFSTAAVVAPPDWA